jgi:hypothetical protein
MTHRLKDPQDYPRRALLAVAGLSPQIVTETLYALAVRGEPRFLPTEVHIITGQRIQAAGQTLHMTPANLACYAVFARRLLAGQGPARHDTDGFTAHYLDALRRISGAHAGNVANAEQTYAQGMDDEQFQVRKARVNKALREALGPQLAAAYLIDDDGGERPHTRYQLNLPVDAVAFGTVEEAAATLQATGGDEGGVR